MEQSWSRDLTVRVGAEVKRLRSQAPNKMSAQALADATAEIGYPISRARIADIENAEKFRGGDIRLAEVLVLATALEVPPLHLVYPGAPGAEVAVTPNRAPTTSILAAQWFSGEEPFTAMIRDPDGQVGYVYYGEDLQAAYYNAQGLRLGREERALLKRQGELRAQILLERDPAVVAIRESALEAVEREIAAVRDRQESAGIPLAELDSTSLHIDALRVKQREV